MDVLDHIIHETAEDGNGSVQYFKKKGDLYLVSIILPEHDTTLYIVPKVEWKKLQRHFNDVDKDMLEEEFWDKMEKFRTGQFERG